MFLFSLYLTCKCDSWYEIKNTKTMWIGLNVKCRIWATITDNYPLHTAILNIIRITNTWYFQYKTRLYTNIVKISNSVAREISSKMYLIRRCTSVCYAMLNKIWLWCVCPICNLSIFKLWKAKMQSTTKLRTQ